VSSRGRYRESELPEIPPRQDVSTEDGRKCISVIGIDQYRRWPTLGNAVSDARGVLAAFEQLGFVPIATPLLDGAATREALRRLPGELRPGLGENDSLVVFFAGHGYTTTRRFPDDYPVSKGYLIPVDADHVNDDDRSWERIETWLNEIAELPPRHVLVILDSCHSGVALSRGILHRGMGVRADRPSVPRHERRSRRVLVSALNDQQALDDGPIAGHSVFTGYLIEALRAGGRAWEDESTVGVGDIAHYVSRRVSKYSGSTQAPELGWLEYDDGGELLLSFHQSCQVSQPPRPAPDDKQPVRFHGRRSSTKHKEQRTAAHDGSRSPTRAPDRHPASPGEQRSSATLTRPPIETGGLPQRSEGWTLDLELAAALDRQGEERRQGAQVLTVVAGDAMAAQTSWGTWAARHGYLTLASQSVGIDAVIADLLAQTPWLRCVPEARRRLATAARIDVQAVDASLDARSMAERPRWIHGFAGLDLHARVSGWLLSWLRTPSARVPDLASAPARQGELLAVACDLASPTAVLLFHPLPDEQWLERAIVTAAELLAYLPAHSVAVTAPEELVNRVLHGNHPGAAWTMARQGLVRVAPLGQRLPGRARHGTMRVLFEALARDPRTRRRFELDGRVATPEGPSIDVALAAHAERIAVELDSWYHFHDPEGYRRDRVQDARLQRAGYFVLRFPAEDVDDRLSSTIEHLAIALAGRRAARALL